MLYTFKDADKHKKGLTVPQKKKWANLVNFTLKTCLKDKGKDCERVALKIAGEKCTATKRMT